MTKAFGQYLKQLRQQANYSQKKLAKRLEIHPTYLSKIENDKLPPPSEDFCITLGLILDIDYYPIILKAGKIPSDYVNVLLANKDICKLIENKFEEKRDD